MPDPTQHDPRSADPQVEAALEQRLRDAELALAERQRRVAGLQELAIALTGARTEEEVAGIVVGVGFRVLGAFRGGVGVVRDETASLELIASAGYEDVGRFTRPVAADGDPWVDVAREGSARFFSTHEDFARAYPLAAGARPPGGGAIALIGLPTAAGPVGSFALSWPAPRDLGDEDRDYLVTLARLCAQALDHVRLLARERQTRRLLGAVLEQMPIAVMVASTDGRVLFRNAGVTAVLGDHPDPVGARPDGRRLAAADWPLARSLATGAVVGDEEIVIDRPDGSHGVIEASSGPILDESGAVVAAVVTYSDVTGRKDAERLRDAFIGVLSHELRTPVTSILGAAVTLRRHAGALPEVDRELVIDVAAEAERLRRIIDDLVVVARMDRGAALAAAEPVALRQVLAAVLEDEQTHWPGVPFVLRAPDRLPPVQGEAGLVDQVLRNLLSNGAKYGGAGRVDVEVGLDAAAREVVVRVLDRGPGLGADEAGSLFDLFYRSPLATRSAPGAGVGLFVSRALVEAMGGRIWAVPRRGGGAEFGFSLPVIGADANDEA